MQTFVSENFRPPSSVNEIGNPTGRTESSAPTMQRQLRLAEYSGNEQKRNCISPSITACSTFICTESYRKSIRLAPDRAFRPRSGQNSRASARNITRLLRIFLPTFSGATEKVGLRSNSCSVTAKEAVPVNPDNRAVSVVRPYNVLCKIVCEATVARCGKRGSSGEYRK